MAKITKFTQYLQTQWNILWTVLLSHQLFYSFILCGLCWFLWVIIFHALCLLLLNHYLFVHAIAGFSVILITDIFVWFYREKVKKFKFYAKVKYQVTQIHLDIRIMMIIVLINNPNLSFYRLIDNSQLTIFDIWK